MMKNLINSKLTLFVFLVHFLNITSSAAQTVYYDNNTNLFGIVDRTGKIILKPSFEEMTMFENGLSRFKKNGKWGLINEKAVIIFQPKFEDLYAFCQLGFSEELISVNLNGKYGYYSEKGVLVIAHKFDSTEQFCNGIAWVAVNGKYSFINVQGKYISNKWFDSVKIVNGISYGVDEKRVYDKDGSYYNEGKPDYYKVNKDGSMSIAENQDYLRNYQSGDMTYCNKLNISVPDIISYFDFKMGKWGYKNSKGDDIGKENYASTSDFEGGFAVISKKGHKGYSIINEKLEILKDLNENFEPIWGSAVKFDNGLIEFSMIISKPDDEIEKREYYLINYKGETIITMNKGIYSVPTGG